jgi:hypothetical protein
MISIIHEELPHISSDESITHYPAGWSAAQREANIAACLCGTSLVVTIPFEIE